MKSILLATALAVAASTSAHAYTITPEPTPGQELRYDHGQAMIVSREAGSIVRVLPKENGPHGRMIFTVLAFNQGSAPFNLGYESVSITNDKGAVRLFSLEDIQREAQKAANWQRFAVAMAASSQAYSAAQANSYSSSGTVYGPYGSVSYYGQGTSYNPALTSMAESEIQAQTASNLQAIAANLDGYMSTIASHILAMTTIDPNTANGGAVFADRPKFAKAEDHTVKVVVHAGAEVHEFTFVVKD